MPNPRDDKVTIEYDGELVQLEVYDARARVVYWNHIQSGDQVDLSSFNSGVYIFYFESSEGSEIRRVVRE